MYLPPYFPKVITNINLVDKINLGPKRKHKKKRIAKKWLKKYGENIIEKPSRDVYKLFNDTLVCHPDTLKEIQRLLMESPFI